MSKYKQVNKHKLRPKIERSRSSSILFLLPLLFIVGILPIIVKMHSFPTNLTKYDWFPNQTYATDFFLYYKQWFFVFICSILVGIIVIRTIMDKNTLKFSKIFYPLFAYGLLALLSSIISKYRYFSFHGYIEQFENVFCIIGYVLVIYYCYLVIESEFELRLVIDSLAIGALLVGIIGTLQSFGLDYFRTRLFQSIIFQKGTDLSSLDFTFNKTHVYSTLFNPNYVGVYTSMMIPLFIALMLFANKIYQYILYSAVILTSTASLLGSGSKTGILSIVISLIVLIIFLRKRITKFWYIIIPLITATILSLNLYNISTDNKLVDSIHHAFNVSKVEIPALSSVNTTNQGVDLVYNNNELTVSLDSDHNLSLIDSNNVNIEYTITDNIDSTGILIQPQDQRFSDIQIANYTNGMGIDFCLFIGEESYPFSYVAIPGTCSYYNRFEKFSPFQTAKHLDLNGYESFGTNRGFIWSRTLPLIKDHIVLGSGADSFAFVYPQYDYIYLNQFSFENSVVSKPHSLYLQISIQSGLISLIAFIVFFVIYIIQCFKLYLKCSFDSLSSQIGIGALIATISFLFTGLSNDSSITVSPVFYVIVGIGIAANVIYKHKESSN